MRTCRKCGKRITREQLLFASRTQRHIMLCQNCFLSHEKRLARVGGKTQIEKEIRREIRTLDGTLQKLEDYLEILNDEEFAVLRHKIKNSDNKSVFRINRLYVKREEILRLLEDYYFEIV